MIITSSPKTIKKKSIQYVLNCGTGIKNHVGSCRGGSVMKLYRFIKEESGMIPYDTCMPYIACSEDSTEGFCPYVNTTCSPINTCRTCDTFVENGGTCREIDVMPNATIAEYGYYKLEDLLPTTTTTIIIIGVIIITTVPIY